MNAELGNEMTSVLEELQEREPLFHRPELGRTRADFERQVAPGFWETGASGQRYSREFVWAALADWYASKEEERWEADEFRCSPAGADTFLLTYTLRQGERVTRRLTVWQRYKSHWWALYHQGTVVTAEPVLSL